MRSARSFEMKVVGSRDAATRGQNSDLAAFAFRRSAIAGHLALIDGALSLLFPKPFKCRAPFIVLRDRNFDPQDRPLKRCKLLFGLVSWRRRAALQVVGQYMNYSIP